MRPLTLLVTVLLALSTGCALVDAPEIDLTFSADHPRLSWRGTEGAVRYQVQLCRRHDFMKDVETLPETEETGLLLQGIVKYNRGYFWRVRAIDSDGFRGPWSRKGYFILPIEPPVPLSPVGDVEDKNPAFTWQRLDCAERYVVEISADNLFRLPEYRYETMALDFFPEPLIPEVGKKYYWRIRAVTADGAASGWSEPVEFTVLASAAAVDLSPSGGSVVSSLKPAFRWSGEEGALRYQVEVIRSDEMGADEARSLRLQFTKGPLTVLTLKKALAPETDYVWRVRPIMPDAPGRWSDYAAFRTPAE